MTRKSTTRAQVAHAARAGVPRRILHGIPQLVGRIERSHGEVGPRRHRRRVRRFKLRLVVGRRRRRRRRRRRGGLRRGGGRHSSPVHRLQRLFVDHRPLYRNRLDNHLGRRFQKSFRRRIQIGEILVLPDGVVLIHHLRHFENVLRNPGNRGEQRQMEKNGNPDPLAQPCPAPLVLQLADHGQQLVRIVVYPARSAQSRGRRRQRARFLIRSRAAGLLAGLHRSFRLVGLSIAGGHSFPRSLPGR